MSKGISMTSTLPRGTARESTLVRAIKADYPPTFDDGPLPDSLTTLLLAKCDPNVIGSPSLSPLGTAIRRGEDRTVEVLLQYQADPQLREDSRELPLIIAIKKSNQVCEDTARLSCRPVFHNVCTHDGIPWAQVQ